MLVRGTRRFASGLAITLVVLTLYMVLYGSSTPIYKQPPFTKGNHQNQVSDPISPPGSKTLPVLPPEDKKVGGGSGAGDLKVPPGTGVTGSGSVPGFAPGTDQDSDSSPKSPTDPGKPEVDRLPAVNPDPIHGEPVKVKPSKQTTAAAAPVPPSKPDTTSEDDSTPTEFLYTPPPQHFDGPTLFVKDTHREIYAKTTEKGNYWAVDFSPWPAYNPNFTPHPKKNDTWIAVAQYHKTAKDNQVWFTQIVCEAKFTDTALKCTHPPWTVPIPPTWSEKCEGEIAHFNFNIGPHDARVFYGPERPYILYGTQSSYSCFGQWFQDFTLVSDWPGATAGDFRRPTEIHRPPPYKYSVVEKNWFLFWDMKDEFYVHHDIYPDRVFGKMNIDGKVDKDGVDVIAAEEKKCLDKLLPYAQKTYAESIHQATNSLSIIMCKRSDPSCVKSPENTFVFHIFHWKSFYEFHGLYEPYVHMFKRVAPFETYAMSSKPLWFRGRRLPGTWREEGTNGWNQTEMVYTTSLAWKDHGQKYEGYLDDTLLIGFGIEDKECGGMDVTAADIFQDIVLCDGTKPSSIDA